MILPLLLAALAAPGPSVRYFEPTGEIRREAVAEVLEERLGLLRVKLADGKVKEIPGKWVLDLQREREEVAEEGDLLRARRDVEAGLRLDEARKRLDALLTASNGWKKEYAEAARADLACRSGEPGALERVRSFLDAWPDSRLTAAVLLARAKILEPPADDRHKQQPFVQCFREIEERGGSRLVQVLAMIEPARRLIRKNEEDPTMFLHNMEKGVSEKAETTDDLPWRICLQSAKQWIRIEYALDVQREATVYGKEPRGARYRLENIREECRYLLPEVYCDVDLALASVERLCGDTQAAAALLKEARDLAPDLGRRTRAEEALQELEKERPAGAN